MKKIDNLFVPPLGGGMEKIMKKICSLCLTIALLASLFTARTYAETMPSAITDQGNGLFQIDAKVTNPDDYKKITGFELTVKLLSPGELGGGALAADALMVAQGAYTTDDFTMNYDGVPRYVGKAKEIFTFSDSFTAPMFFSHASSDSVFSSEGTTVKYEGNSALFSDTNSVLSVYGIFGTFEVTDVKWIFGDITNTNTSSDNENWPVSVETVKYNDVATVEKGTDSNYVDIEVPKGEGPFPVILWTHGGGWTSLDRKSCFIKDTMNYLLSKGYAVVSTEYTLTKSDGNGVYTTGYPQMIYDLKAAVRYLRANGKKYNLDTSFIAAMGESAGAHLSMLLGTTNGNPAYEDLTMGNANYSSDVQAIVSYFGPSNFVASDNELFGLACLGNNYTQEQAKAASPYYQITKNCPPLFLTHGKNDAVVPFQQSVDMAAKAKSLIGEDNVTTLFYDNAQHANIGAYDTKLAAESVEAFLDKHLSAYKSSTQKPTVVPSLKKSSVTLYLKGSKKKLTYKINTVSSTGYKITYKSSKTNIAVVNSKGVITAKKVGSAKVNVTFKKGSKTYTKSIKVTVKLK